MTTPPVDEPPNPPTAAPTQPQPSHAQPPHAQPPLTQPPLAQPQQGGYPQGGYPSSGYPPGYPQQGYPAPAPAYPPHGYALPPGGGYLPAPPAVSPAGQPLAEFTDRLLARLIDSLILGSITSVIIIPIYLIAVLSIFNDFGTTVVTTRGLDDPAPATSADVFAIMGPLFGLFILVFALSILFAYLYDVEMMFRSGQTVGKRVMKIQVVPVDPTLALTRVIATKRFLVQHGSALVTGLTLLDGLWQLWDKPWRQCLHDKFAKTLVIKLNP